jgi:hypothetical protein
LALGYESLIVGERRQEALCQLTTAIANDHCSSGLKQSCLLAIRIPDCRSDRLGLSLKRDRTARLDGYRGTLDAGA